MAKIKIESSALEPPFGAQHNTLPTRKVDHQAGGSTRSFSRLRVPSRLIPNDVGTVRRVEKGPRPGHLIVAWKKAPRKTTASRGSSLRAFQRRQGGPKRTPRHLTIKPLTRRLPWPRNQPLRQ